MLLMKHRDTFDADVIHRLERIQKNVEIETDLIGELLELSRIKTRRQRPERVDLDAMARELGEMFESDLKQNAIDFIIDNPLPEIFCESARMRQVFQNLIDNAIKYIGNGPTRAIHIGCRKKPGEYEFYVRDTGIGIDPQDLDKVFFIFRRGRNNAGCNVAARHRPCDGEKHHRNAQRINLVESAPGKGSAFRFTISDRVESAASQQPRDALVPA